MYLLTTTEKRHFYHGFVFFILLDPQYQADIFLVSKNMFGFDALDISVHKADKFPDT